jgi:hypothetical protein
MAISRVDLVNEVLPELNKLFNAAYEDNVFMRIKHSIVKNSPHADTVVSTSTETLREIWQLRFGDALTLQTIGDTDDFVKGSFYLAVYGELRDRKQISYNEKLEVFVLNEEKNNADH